MAEPFVGEIKLFAGSFALRNFAFCNGDTLKIYENQALYSVIGTNFGGDGQNTFMLPDFRGRAPMHWGSAPGMDSRNIGDKTGSDMQSLTEENLPAHTHDPWINSKDNPVSDSPTGNFVDRHVDDYNPANIFKTNPDLNACFESRLLSLEGGQEPHNNLQPFQNLTFIIALVGIYPNRN